MGSITIIVLMLWVGIELTRKGISTDKTDRRNER